MPLPTAVLQGGVGGGRRPSGAGFKSRFALRKLLPLIAIGCFVLFFVWPSSDLRSRIDLSSSSASLSWKSFKPHERSPPADRTPKPRAAFVALVRERNLDGLLNTMRDVQWAFNDDPASGYDYVFLSEVPFTDWFKEHVNNFLIGAPSRPKVHYGLVDKATWDIPAHIDVAKAKERWAKMQKTGVPYAGSQSYRQMCRYYSGPIFHHPLLARYEYVWRIEPDTKHLCRYVSQWQRSAETGKTVWLERDPFRYMKKHKKKYAWIITLLDYTVTVRTLMVHVNKWRNDNPAFVSDNNALHFTSDDGKGFNKCHFWTNYEIIDLSFARSAAYQSFFNAMDKAGGFFYERWGDGPVRSLAASLILDKDEIWRVENGGYFHPPYLTCPRRQDPGSQCACDPQLSLSYDSSHVSCNKKWDAAFGRNATEIVMKINMENGMGETPWPDQQPPHVVTPDRLRVLG
jgi:alpha 1,2-mannosyltransferase